MQRNRELREIKQSTHNAVNKRRTMEARVNEMKEERKWKVGGKREWYD